MQTAATGPGGARAGSFRVRRAAPSDLDAVHTLHAEAFPAGVAFSRDVVEGMLRHAQATALLAEDDVGPVGFAGAVQGAPDAATLWTIHVAPRARGRGVGRRLMDELEDILVARGVRRLALEVWVGNDAAFRLYEKRGFARIGFNDGAFADAVPPGSWEMEKALP